MKIEISKKNLAELRNDVDTLKMQIHKVSVQIDDTLRENGTLKRMCDNRETEIAALIASNREIEKCNEVQIEENKNLNQTLKNLKDERNRAEE
jgi:peptidoglycan hydrolase CwlO-like protein